MNCHPVKIDDDSASECISDTEDWLNWNGNLDNPNDSEDDCVADIESEIEQDNHIKDPQCPEQRDVSAVPHVLGLIRSTQKSKRQAGKIFVTVNAMEWGGIRECKKTKTQCVNALPASLCILSESFS